jgi:hypothetical protein
MEVEKMAFRPAFETSGANFRELGRPDEPDAFTPRLTLQKGQSQSMVLTELLDAPTPIPQPGRLGLAAAILKPPPLTLSTDRFDVATIEQAFDGWNLFTVTAKNLSNVARIRANGRASMVSNQFNAELIVTVVDKPPQVQQDPSDVIAGLVEGLSKSVSPALLVTVMNKFKGPVSDPRDIGLVLPTPLFSMPISVPGASLVISFQIGYAKGLWAGLKDLVDFPGEKELKELARTLSKVMVTFCRSEPAKRAAQSRGCKVY